MSEYTKTKTASTSTFILDIPFSPSLPKHQKMNQQQRNYWNKRHNTNSVLSILRMKAVLQRAVIVVALHTNAENTQLNTKQAIPKQNWKLQPTNNTLKRRLCAFVYAHTHKHIARASKWDNHYIWIHTIEANKQTDVHTRKHTHTGKQAHGRPSEWVNACVVV